MRVRWFLSRMVVSLLMLSLMVVAVSCARKPTEEASKGPQWPERDITLLVPFKAGGGFDITARVAAPIIEKYLPKKANVIVKNVEGAGGKVGLMEVINSKPDGHTIGVFDPVQLAVMQVLGELGSVDMTKLTWLGQLDWADGMLAIGARGRFKNIQEMKGQEVRFGVTSQAAFSATVVGKALGATPKLITYDGVGDACMAAMRGDVDAVVFLWSSLIRQVRASEGKLIAVLVAADKRVPQLPDIPTAAELGVTVDGKVLGCAHVLAGPPGITGQVADAMKGVIGKAIRDSDFSAQMDKAGYPATPLDGKELTDTVSSVLKAVEGYRDLLLSLQQR